VLDGSIALARFICWQFNFFPQGLQLLLLIEIEKIHTIVTRKKGRIYSPQFFFFNKSVEISCPKKELQETRSPKCESPVRIRTSRIKIRIGIFVMVFIVLY
jgi:hypothetical protein